MNKEIENMTIEDYDNLRDELDTEFPGVQDYHIAIVLKSRINKALKFIENEGIFRPGVEIKNIENILRGVSDENDKFTNSR